MENAGTALVVGLEDTAGRDRAKQRLYVLFQLGGWGCFLAVQVFFALYFSARSGRVVNPMDTIAMVCMGVTSGLLISHYSRAFVARWTWKQLGWRPLVLRVAAFAVVLAVVWVSFGFLYNFGVLRQPWPDAKYSPPLVFSLQCVNATFIFIGWFGLYFFYHLFDRFNRSEIERLRLTTHVKEAELRALKSQVNPHFIFNSLNSLRALIDENPVRAREAVTQLANLLRYSLQSGQLETVPFEDELRVANDYLALEQVRHEERLRIRLDIAPETLSLPIPPMLLQTLVENAVKYGISMRPGGGEVAIIARRENNALRLQVTNPGVLALGPSPRSASSTGLGLQNAAERLRLLFGDRASLQLRAASPEQVVAEAIVPFSPLRA